MIDPLFLATANELFAETVREDPVAFSGSFIMDISLFENNLDTVATVILPLLDLSNVVEEDITTFYFQSFLIPTGSFLGNNIDYFLIPPIYFFYDMLNVLDSTILSGFSRTLQAGGHFYSNLSEKLFPSNLSSLESPLSSVVSVINTTATNNYIEPTDPHYGHHPLDHKYWKNVYLESIKPEKGYRYQMRVESLFDNIIVGYINKQYLLHPETIPLGTLYEHQKYYKGVPYEFIRPFSATEWHYFHQPIGYHDRRSLADPTYVPGQNRDVIRLYGCYSEFYKLDFLWLETDQIAIEKLLIKYCPRVTMNDVVYPDRTHPYFILVFKVVCKLAVLDGYVIDNVALTNWSDNEEYFKYFCEEIFEKYYIKAIRETELIMDPGKRMTLHVKRGEYKCW